MKTLNKGEKRASSTPIIAVVSGLVLLSAIGALWLMVFRESARKELLLEYEAFRTSTELLDEFRRDRSFTPVNDKRLLGFGIYTPDGLPAVVHGSAPASYLPARLSGSAQSIIPQARAEANLGNVEVRLSPDAKTIVLVRYSGSQQGQRGMMGLGQGRAGLVPSSPMGFSTANGPYFVWIEYIAESFFSERIQFIIVAGIVTAALLGLFLVLLRFSIRNEDLRLKEIETRELVQLGEAARTLVHEIKNPLGIMRIQTARLRRNIAQSQDLAASTSTADIIDSEIMRLSAMADRIREFLKAGPATLDKVELKAFLTKYATRYKALGELGIKVELELPLVDSAEAMCDADKLITALDNLVANALEAIRGSQSGEGKGRVTLRLYTKNAQWCIAVSDTGPGVARDVRARIFDPFFTTKEKGSGIGLSLAKRIALSFGGNLTLEEEDGEGATFVLALKPAM